MVVPKPRSLLTRQETVVLHGISLGLTNVEIGKRFGKEPSTVKYQVRSLMRKLGATNRTHALVLGIKLGLVTIDVSDDPPHSPQVRWVVEVRGTDGGWRPAEARAVGHLTPDKAHKVRAEMEARSSQFTFRVVRATTAFALDDTDE